MEALDPAVLRRERVVTLFTRGELDRIDAFRADQRIVHRSELFRHAILSQVEQWEMQK